MNPEEWCREYERTRYLREVSNSVLQQRFDDLASNLWMTDAQGNVVTTPDPRRRLGLVRLIVHVMLEQMERAHMASRDFDERAIITAAAANYRRPRLKSPITISPGCLAKFGRREHIASLRQGSPPHQTREFLKRPFS
jgi:hypothetical protein